VWNFAVFIGAKVYYVGVNRRREAVWREMTKEEKETYLETTKDRGNKRLDFRFGMLDRAKVSDLLMYAIDEKKKKKNRTKISMNASSANMSLILRLTNKGANGEVKHRARPLPTPSARVLVFFFFFFFLLPGVR
jgi:hypothetical protein